MPDAGFASLGPSLLARKGGAKPAMRPQLQPLVQDQAQLAQLADEQLEDLGWNDMGDAGSESPVGAGAEIVPIHSAAASSDHRSSTSPVVRRQHKDLDDRLDSRFRAEAVMTGPETAEEGEDEEYAADGAIRPTDRAGTRTANPASRSGPAHGRRAAFTLRLDAERHLKLRLAATMHGVSAQALLTEALDAMLAEHDDLDAIAARIRRH